MVRSIGAQVGLLAFAVAILAGMYVGNTEIVVLTRALVALVLGAIVGQAAGWGAKQVLRDFLQSRKLEIDKQHLAAVEALNQAAQRVGAEEPPGSDEIVEVGSPNE